MTLVGLVRRVIAAPKSPALQLAVVVAGVGLAAALRWFVDRGASGMPFITFVPVVVLAAIFLQWPFAVLAALGSLAAIVAMFAATARIDFTVPNYILWAGFTFVSVFMIVTGYILRQTILELDAQSARIRAFNAELQHRTKNTLQIVRVLAGRATGVTDPADFYATLSGRLDALAKANALLGPGTMQRCDMADLVATALQPFPAAAIEAMGPPASIAGDPGTQLVMVLHELGTNATKYGALSAEGGRVKIGWQPLGETIEIVWEESGGPPVSTPTKRGLGSRLLAPIGAMRAVMVDYRPEGLVCRLAVATGGG